MSEHWLRYRADGVDMAGNLSYLTVNFSVSVVSDYLRKHQRFPKIGQDDFLKETGRYTYGMFKEKDLLSKLASKTCFFFYQQAAHVKESSVRRKMK